MSFFTYNNHPIYYERHGEGAPLLLLHGNTAASRMFDPIIPVLSAKYTVLTMDFLGCGRSGHLPLWPSDLWFEWAKQAHALCAHLHLKHIRIVGTSGGALAAINAALEYPQMVDAVVADSFAGIRADPMMTNRIQAGRNAAKQMAGFCSYLQSVHGDDWKQVLDADTDAIVRHAREIGAYFHRPLSSLQCRMLLTGSEEDEMFPQGHCRRLFAQICRETDMATAHIFPHGGHPAMLSNMNEFAALLEGFFA